MSHDSWLFRRLFQSWRLLAGWTSDVEGSFTGSSDWWLIRSKMWNGVGPLALADVRNRNWPNCSTLCQIKFHAFFYPSHHVCSLLVGVSVGGFPEALLKLLNVALLIWVGLRLSCCVEGCVVATSSEMLAVEVQSTINQLKSFYNISVFSFRLIVMVWVKFSLDICNQVSAEMTLCCPQSKIQIGSNLKKQLHGRVDWMALSGHSHC